MFVERKVIGRLRGEEARHFSALGGWKDLADCVSLKFVCLFFLLIVLVVVLFFIVYFIFLLFFLCE